MIKKDLGLFIPPRSQFFPSKYEHFYNLSPGEHKDIEAVPAETAKIIAALHRSKLSRTEHRRYSTRQLQMEPPKARITRLV